MVALNHVILYPEFDLYDDPTANFAAFGVLAAENYDKPVVRVSAAGATLARTPAMQAQDHTAPHHHHGRGRRRHHRPHAGAQHRHIRARPAGRRIGGAERRQRQCRADSLPRSQRMPSRPLGRNFVSNPMTGLRPWIANPPTPTPDLLISDGCDWSGVIAKLFAKSMRPARKAG
jgi:hypothetical protein